MDLLGSLDDAPDDPPDDPLEDPPDDEESVVVDVLDDESPDDPVPVAELPEVLDDFPLRLSVL